MFIYFIIYLESKVPKIPIIIHAHGKEHTCACSDRQTDTCACFVV